MKNSDQTDKVINEQRGRGWRNTLLAGYVPAAGFLITTSVQALIALPFSGNAFANGLAWAIGAAATIATLGYTVPKWFLVRNEPNHMSVTQDAFRSFFSGEKIHVSYGAGWQTKFPWEALVVYISLEDIPVPLKFELMVHDALLNGEGSFRYRPDALDPITFMQSAASVGEEIRDLVIAEIAVFFSTDAVGSLASTDTTVLTKLLNEHLKRELGPGKKATLEKQNAVSISDATVRKLLPSEELQRTLSAVSEARAVQKGVEILLGRTPEEINTALKDGSLTQADVAEARRVFLFISGNTQGFERKEFVLRLEGVSPEVASALGKSLNNPAVQGGIIAASGSGTPQQKGKPGGK